MSRWDESFPYERINLVAKMKCSVLIERQFAFGYVHLGRRGSISHIKPEHGVTQPRDTIDINRPYHNF